MSYLNAVLSAAPLLLRKWDKKERLALQDAVRIAVPKHRAAACLRHRLGSSGVTVSATAEGGTRLGGVMVCDASHVCPVCHHRKMAEDKALLAEIVSQHYAAAGFMVDAVLTVPHRAGEALADVLDRLDTAWNALRSKPLWRQLSIELGIVGCIRRLEVTLGTNGWHPHYHVSFLCDWAFTKGIKGHTRHKAMDDAFSIVAGSWSDAGKRAGIAVCLYAQAAVTIIEAVDAAKAVAYNAKNMGFAGKSSSLTPMDLLRIINQAAAPSVALAARKLFAEYANAIHGRHTMSYLGTAKEAKSSIKGKSTAPKSLPKAEKLGTLSPIAWSAVVTGGLRWAVAQVTTRCELVALVLKAALLAGYSSIPVGWVMVTPESKTVIDVKSMPGGAC